jgi:hypothetical protein
MRLSGRDRASVITDIVGRPHAPTLLVCAGWSLDCNADLESLTVELRIAQPHTSILVEVHHDETQGGKHGMYFLPPGRDPISLGGQIFAAGEQLNGADGAQLLIRFEAALPQRIAQVTGQGRREVGVLCCGEINILRAPHRADLVCRSDKLAELLKGVDILLNATHDRMSPRGRLPEKRRWLSNHTRGHVYVSASNWNSARNQRPHWTSLHTVYVSGERREYHRFADPRKPPQYEYREFEVPG